MLNYKMNIKQLQQFHSKIKLILSIRTIPVSCKNKMAIQMIEMIGINVNLIQTKKSTYNAKKLMHANNKRRAL